jgi:hypothetical protein
MGRDSRDRLHQGGMTHSQTCTCGCHDEGLSTTDPGTLGNRGARMSQASGGPGIGRQASSCSWFRLRYEPQCSAAA